MKLFGLGTNSEMIWKISDWLGMNFNPKLSPGIEKSFSSPLLPWRTFWIKIYSEPIRNFPNHSEICIRAKQIHSDLIR